MSAAGGLGEWVAEAAERLGVPGVAAAVLADGEAAHAFHGVTSVEHPLPVDASTIFQLASVGKTFTATAVLQLVERGEADLDAPVRTYVPELKLKDEDVAARVTVLQLLNHTAGWEGDLTVDTGEGDDALARAVEAMAGLEQISPPGTAYAYNNASLVLAGRLIEKVIGKTYEAAVEELLLRPLGLSSSFFSPNDVMTRRFAVGHIQRSDGSIVTARPWASPRGGNPAGGVSSTAGDLLAWARFHLGDGRAPDGTRVLSQELLLRMRRPTIRKPLGDAMGIGWMLRDIDGVALAGHGGSGIGQFTECLLVPERGFAVVSLTNSGPNGIQLNQELLRWALQEYLGLAEPDPVPSDLGPEELAVFAGAYGSAALTCALEADGGGLRLTVQVRPEVLQEAGEEDPAYPPMHLGLLPGEGDRYLITDGPFAGLQGFFTRDPAGAVDGIDLGGRMLGRERVDADSG